jgi:hypothetical protein
MQVENDVLGNEYLSLGEETLLPDAVRAGKG